MSESESLVGVSLGQYEILSLLGKGGMATVYKANQTSIRRIVAIKVLPRALMHDETFMERFRREAEVIARLEHFHILPIYDYGEFEGMPYIVMRYLEGGNVQDRIREGNLTWQEIVRITSQVAGALDYAHARNVIHRDIKPSNIMLDGEGNAYLADFGIAKMQESTAQLTGSGIVGTPAYMAPEQSEPGPPTPAMDVYALGCTVFEMITGHVPYIADTPIAQILMHIQQPTPSLLDYDPAIPYEVDEVVRRAMAKSPQERYRSAGDFAREFQAAAAGMGEIAQPTRQFGSRAATIPGAISSDADEATAQQRAVRPTPRPTVPAVAPAAVRKPAGWIIGAVVAVIAIAAIVTGIFLAGRIGGQARANATATANAATQQYLIAEAATSTITPTRPPTETPTITSTPTNTAIPSPTPTPTEPPTPTPLPATRTVGGVPMVLVPAGTFIMGTDDLNAPPRERPAHEVYLDAFYIDETEVTNQYYRACVEEGGCPYPEFTTFQIWDDYFTAERFNNYPVLFISWPEAQNYCRWRGGHLPTEAQWEKAARWDPVTGEQRELFPWGNAAPDLYYTNFGSNIGRPEPVASRPAGASPVGAYDMAGNVAEWVYDWYQYNYYEISPHDNPTGPATGDSRVLRGGWWDSRGRYLAVTYRDYIGPGTKEDYIGFRCAYTPSGDPTLAAEQAAGGQ